MTHAFNPQWWGSVDLRWQYGGETQTDGIADDNRTNILGGGPALGMTDKEAKMTALWRDGEAE